MTNLNPTKSGQPLLNIEELSVGYPNKVLLSNLNLQLNPNELVCFMGPNGIGKSSLIKTILGLNAPLTGKIDFLEDVPRERAASVVLTDRIHHPLLTVSELIAMGRYPYLDWRMSMKAADIEKIDTAIGLVRIHHLRDRKIIELSDGQMQMVMIARALAQDTKILLLDEPTAHLDLNNRVEIMNMLKRLTRETNRAILMATHELDLALQTADRVWIAGADKSIKSGIPEDLVLDGSFDQVFQFKGYDLKTGKIEHEEYRDKQVKVQGAGYVSLWTKNALERNGYSLSDRAEINIVASSGKHPTWTIANQEFKTLNELLNYLALLK